ncbi:MAG: hypothetical protein OER90_00995 [Gemmatimonadota bacterium]|nr:hypothetical protein [Gemmatimonadota bacterium]
MLLTSAANRPGLRVTATAVALLLAGAVGCDRNAPAIQHASASILTVAQLPPDSLVATPITVSLDLRLKRSFDYTEYYGVLHSQRELNALWKQLVTVDDASDLGVPFLGGNVPEPPTVDFTVASVLWFADRGAKASFVASLELQPVPPDTVKVIVTAFHSDFGSRGLNLWSMPRFDGSVIFEVRHEYEERSP